MALDTMRRYLTPMEEDVEGGLPEPTGPLAALGRVSEMARIANMGPQPISEIDTSKPDPLEGVPLTEAQMAEARAARARRGQRLGPELRVADTEAPIPVANASTRVDATVPTTSALPSTGPRTPAGKPESMGKPGLPAPETGAGGDASERDLYLARLAAQSAAGFGGMGAGKSIDMGIADTLGERLKQVQALRAKREEQSLEQQRERATWGASNRATLASALAQWKGDEAKTAALEALASGADTTKPGDFSRNVVNAVMTKPKVLGAEAGVEKTVEQAGVAREQKAAIPAKVEQGAGKLAETIRSNKANEEIRRQAILAKQLSDTKANNAVRAAGSDARAAEKAITDAMKSAEKKDLGIASNIRDFQGLEKVAPGFTRGVAPSWLGQGGIAAAIKVPALNKQATQLASALELFTAGIRNSLFGASLTGNEKESFDSIVSSGVLMPPDVLAANINRLREGAAKFAQNHFTVAQELHPEVTSRVLRASTLFGPAVGEGGIYSDVWQLPKAGPADAPTGMVKIKHSSGLTTTVDRATADQMLKDDPKNFSEVK